MTRHQIKSECRERGVEYADLMREVEAVQAEERRLCSERHEIRMFIHDRLCPPGQRGTTFWRMLGQWNDPRYKGAFGGGNDHTVIRGFDVVAELACNASITATDSGEYDVWKRSQQHRYSYPTLDAAMDAAIALLPTEDLPMIYPTGRIVDGREEYTFGVLGGTALPTTAIAAPLRDEGRSLWRYGRPVSIDGNGMATDGTIIMCAPLPVDGDILTVNGGKCSLRRGTAIVRPVCDAPTGMAVGVYVRSRGEWMPWSSPFEFEFAGRRFLADYNPQGASWKPLGVSYTANAACNSLLGALRGPDGWETVWLGGEPVVTADSEGVRYTLQRHASQPGCVDYFGVVAPLYAIEVSSHEN